jgi:predicted RND superfamily exporter protein
MTKLKKLISKLKKIPKTRYIAILFVFVLAVAIAIPTLSRYKNRIDINALLSDENNWDGTVATSYRNGSGTSSDPYIISNAKELAYFEKMLHETSYENTYFELANDIIINNP